MPKWSQFVWNILFIHPKPDNCPEYFTSRNPFELAGDTGTTDEICRIMEQSACTSNQHSAKNILTESSLITEDEDTSVPVSACYTEDKVCQISLSGSEEMEIGGETSAPISNTDTIDKALQISLGSDYDSSPAIVVSTKAKSSKNKKGTSIQNRTKT